MYLVDTNVLSATAPARQPLSPGLVAWLDGNTDRLFLSAITIAELTDGIAKLRRDGATRKAIALAGWLDALLHLYAARILPLDTAVAISLGQLSDAARARGEAPGMTDLTVAATASVHGYTILTRNMRHFRTLGVPVCDPFDSLPPVSG